MRARVEVAGRLELNAVEVTALARTKAVHIGLIVLAVLAGVWSSHPSGVFSVRCVHARVVEPARRRHDNGDSQACRQGARRVALGYVGARI